MSFYIWGVVWASVWVGTFIVFWWGLWSTISCPKNNVGAGLVGIFLPFLKACNVDYRCWQFQLPMKLWYNMEILSFIFLLIVVMLLVIDIFYYLNTKFIWPVSYLFGINYLIIFWMCSSVISFGYINCFLFIKEE